MRSLELLRNYAFVSLVDGKKITSMQIKWQVVFLNTKYTGWKHLVMYIILSVLSDGALFKQVGWFTGGLEKQLSVYP